MIMWLFGCIEQEDIINPVNQEPSEPIVGNEVGNQAPEFSLPDENGNLVSLSDYAGKQNVILLFHTGSTWGTCGAQLRELQANYEKIKESNTIILSISAVSQTTAKSLVNAFGLNYPVLSDVNTQTIQNYGVLNSAGNNAVISIFIIDTQGIIRWKQIPENTIPGEQIIQELQKIQ